MPNFTTVYVPILFGLLLITAVQRAMVFWQRERSQRIFFAFMTYATLCLLYLAGALEWPAVWRDAIRVVLLWALAFGNWHEWRYLFAFLHKKEDDAALPVPPLVTLGGLGEADDAPAIEASKKAPDLPATVVAIQATQTAVAATETAQSFTPTPTSTATPTETATPTATDTATPTETPTEVAP